MPNGSAEEWEAAWRKSVDTRLSSFDGKLDTLIESMQKLYTRMTVNETAIQEMRDAKKTAPREVRGWIDIGCMGILALFSMTALLISAITLLSAHWH